MLLFIDIETVPTQRTEIIERLRAEVEAAAKIKSDAIRQQYKKPETIEAHLRELRENLPGVVDDAYRKTALDGGFGEVICIGWAFDADPVQTLCRKLAEPEAELLRAFLDKLPSPTTTPVSWVGHNIAGFDLRFLWQRCLVQGIRPPAALSVDARDGLVFDTMIEWAGHYNRDRWPSLETLCHVFSLPLSKTNLKGGKVWDFARAGRYEEIAAYCRADVEAVRRVHHAMNAEIHKAC